MAGLKLSIKKTRNVNCGLALVWAGLFAGCVSVAAAQVPQQDEPTAGEDALTIDQAWQKASSKYDKERDALLATVNKVSTEGPFIPDWASLEKYEVPEWYKDAKFGIFIHWGVYSVPAFGSEWYPRLMYMEGSPENKHQVETYGPLTKFGYKDFIPMFTAEHFDAKQWAALFKESGAKYVVPVFEHHDGFAMYDSGLSDWTVKKMGPHRDTGGELAAAVRAEGLHLGASSHRIEHDWFLEGGRKEPSDVNDPKYAAFYGPAHAQGSQDEENFLQNWTYVSPEYANDWLARDAEIVEKYHPDIMYFDWWIGQPMVRPYLAKFAAFYYNESLKYGKEHAQDGSPGPVGIINYKLVDMAAGSAVLDFERGQTAAIQPFYWQTDTSVSNKSWGYIKNDNFKTPDFIVKQLADIVSKNGNLLMNIGPRSDGTIPDEVQQVLRDVGGWLKVNGDAIYGTRPFTTFGEGPTQVKPGQFHDTDTVAYTPQDFRFTTKAGALYAIEMEWPTDGEAVIHTLTNTVTGEKPVSAVTLLDTGAKLEFSQKADGLHITVPKVAPGKYAFAYRVDF
jgi:alpha-L-fucosidase